MKDTLIILCLLGDPTLPATSIKHTGGFQVDVQELLSTIDNPDCNVHIITNTSHYRKEYQEMYHSYTVHRVHFEDNWMSDQNLLMKNFDSIKQDFFRILKQIPADNGLIHSFYWLSGILAYEAYKNFSINYVHTTVSLSIGKELGGSSAYYDGQFEWEKIFLKNAKKVFTITEIEKQHLLKYYDIPDSQLNVIGRGVHPVFEKPCRSRFGYPTELMVQEPIELMRYKWWIQGAFTYVGRIQEIKGVNHIISAWLKLYETYKESMPPLWICGGTPENIELFRCELQQQLDFERLQNAESDQKIVWWGYLDFAGLSTLFLKTKVLVTHSQYEPGGRVLLEAMAASIPVIATPNGFGKDMIQNGKNGFLVNYSDVDDLAEKMELFIQNPALSDTLGKNARQSYQKQKESWKCYQKQFKAYIKYGLNSFERSEILQ